MARHMIVHEVIWDVRIDDHEELEELRRRMVHGLQDIERALDGGYVGAVELFVPEPLWIS